MTSYLATLSEIEGDGGIREPASLESASIARLMSELNVAVQRGIKDGISARDVTIQVWKGAS